MPHPPRGHAWRAVAPPSAPRAAIIRRMGAGAAPAGGDGAAPAAAQRAPGGQDPLVGDLRRTGLLPLLVLHYVTQEPCYGNQLIELIAALTTGALGVNPNTMYPLLRTLEERGLVEGEWEHPDRRTRRFYRITPAGAQERERLLRELAPRLDRISRSIEAIRAEVRCDALG
jgi:DNA-binding PadR family transcriptional regulator